VSANLVGLDENRLGFRSGFLGEVLEVLGDWAVVQVEVGEAAGDTSWDGRSLELPQFWAFDTTAGTHYDQRSLWALLGPIERSRLLMGNHRV
jgi:hypothetical protein